MMILEGYFDLLEETPRAVYSNLHAIVKACVTPGIKRPFQDGALLPHLLHTPWVYLPDFFVLAECHGFIFRLTPF
ncbi:hypothetical protein [Rufibacter psychrotolerans]|uniref:hypothetical protein n=1 Tax=Rufibacter psychrotolerans TaxID=2812556 RepID=UPI001966E280|nr:hypothetical protein [Rufibacter sp. SYSU D00308]